MCVLLKEGLTARQSRSRLEEEGACWAVGLAGPPTTCSDTGELGARVLCVQPLVPNGLGAAIRLVRHGWVPLQHGLGRARGFMLTEFLLGPLTGTPFGFGLLAEDPKALELSCHLGPCRGQHLLV